ncbi:sporulation protein YqfD [Bacillus massiliigorillae]|uniref:sporulation protein YqfD n=1 Tax=Bacillus massiliigorillae TaxID=1243664 RepID=UPI0003A59B0F|nr:sporulation protein YqfD [Bacillus massiliigorillae]
MKNQWTNFYAGNVEVKAYGQQVEAFVNDMVRKRIRIWNMKKMGTDAICFTIALYNVKKMRVIIRKYDCKATFLKRSGVPFLWRRLLFNSGFLIGFFLFLTCLFLLSNVVWGIEISGAKPETEHKIRQQLTKMGVETGKFQFNMDESGTIQQKLSSSIDEITWVGVELKGTTFHLQVVEKKEPKRAKMDSRQNIIANKKAIVRKIFVEKGKAAVSVNDYVNKGQVLVSSNISNNDKSSVLVPAKGSVWGEVWYKSDVAIPLKTEFSVFSGKEETKHYVKMKTFSLPIWGFKKTTIVNYEKDITDKPLFFLGWKLPFSYKTVTFRDKESVVREYSKKEAILRGHEVAENDLKKMLPKNSEVIGRKVLRESFESGKVILSIHYQVLENIAIERPIIQGD